MFWEEGSYFWDVHFDLHPDKNRIGSRGGQTDENWRGHFCPAEKSTTHPFPLTNSLHRKRSFRFPRAQRRNHFSPSLPPPPSSVLWHFICNDAVSSNRQQVSRANHLPHFPPHPCSLLAFYLRLVSRGAFRFKLRLGRAL